MVFNKTITANTDIFDNEGGRTQRKVLTIFCTFDTSGVLTLRRKVGVTTVSEKLNLGTALTANVMYPLDVVVDVGETINLQYSVNAVCLKAEMVEND